MPKILVIRLSSLGDVVLTAPVYRALKSHWPECSISVLVKPQFAPALEGNGHVDEIIAYRGFWPTLMEIRRRNFTHLLDLHANLRSLLIRRMTSFKNVAVYRKDALARRLFVAFGWNSVALQKHTVDRYLRALSQWGIPLGDPSIKLGDQREGRHPLASGKPKNIIVVQSAFLGDSLLTLPLVRQIKASFPEARLTVLTLESTAEIFRGGKWVDEIILDHKRGEHRGISGLWALARGLKAKRFDLAIVPHRSLRSALLAWLSGVPERIGFTSSAGSFLFTRTVMFAWPMHDLERNLALMLPLSPGLALSPSESIYISPEPSEALDRRLREAGVGSTQEIVGVHPGSAWPTKRWLSSRFAEICRRFKADGFAVVLVGGPQDKQLCLEIAAASGAVDWAGKTDLRELKSLMGRFRMFITNDSGPMHIATAAGVPTLAIFGPTTRELGFFPYGSDHRVLESELACRPCGLHGGRYCPEGHFLCMKLITVEDVWRTAQRMLEHKEVAS